MALFTASAHGFRAILNIERSEDCRDMNFDGPFAQLERASDDLV